MYFHNGLYKYFVGATNSYDDIIKLQNDLRNTYNDCFIIAFKNGQRITIKQAKKELN